MKKIKTALNGGEAIALALKQINPEVFAMFPITPQTPIIETFAKYKADGIVDTEIIRAESEYSALSAAVGAATAGVRAITATSSQGLLYMYEVLGIAAGLRLPIVMPIANRAISAPINIHCDHSDTMSTLDQGWLQVYCENAQEAYDMTLFSLKLAEAVYLPIMVCIDGFITSHNLENLEIYDNESVKKFIGEYEPNYSVLDTENPQTIGAVALTNSYFEIRKEMFDAFLKVGEKFKEIATNFENHFGKKIKIYEDYYAKDSKTVIIVLSSTAEATKDVIDKLREEGYSVGLLRPILYRPFIYEEYAKALEKAENIIILERTEGPGSNPPLYKDIVITAYNHLNKPKILSKVFGLGGREITQKEIKDLIKDVVENKPTPKYVGLK